MKPHWLVLALIPVAHAQTPGKCAELTKFTVPGVPMVIHKAEIVAASDGTPAHCQADGTVNERTGAGGKTYGIGFAVALPDNWNNRFLFQGGGGYNGSVRPPLGGAAAGDSPGLARGFAVASTDSGHTGATFDTTYNIDQQARFRPDRRRARCGTCQADHHAVLRPTTPILLLRWMLHRRA
jgi:Tannase and feruloyl esterase